MNYGMSVSLLEKARFFTLPLFITTSLRKS
jgi:hypothetical protein